MYGSQQFRTCLKTYCIATSFFKLVHHSLKVGWWKGLHVCVCTCVRVRAASTHKHLNTAMCMPVCVVLYFWSGLYQQEPTRPKDMLAGTMRWFLHAAFATVLITAGYISSSWLFQREQKIKNKNKYARHHSSLLVYVESSPDPLTQITGTTNIHHEINVALLPMCLTHSSVWAFSHSSSSESRS